MDSIKPVCPINSRMVLKIVVVLALVAAASANPARIVGGTPTSIEAFPYIVSYTYFYPGPSITVQRCVGSLISSWHVLTSGFCFTGAVLDNMKIRAGSTFSLTGGLLIDVNTFIKHPDYDEVPRTKDIAITFLRTPLGITDTVNVMFLPPQGTFIADGSSLKVVSWGFESPTGPQLDFLKTVELFKLGIEECKVDFADSVSVVIEDNVICAASEGKGMCSGDSGAPMAMGQVVVGLSSYFESCDKGTHPDVFTRIDHYTNWILQEAVAPSTALPKTGRYISSPVVA